MNICSPCSGDFAFVKYLCLGCLEDVALVNTRMLVYMAPRSYSSLGNTRMLNKFTKVSRTFQLFIHATKITNFWLQQHNHFLECKSIYSGIASKRPWLLEYKKYLLNCHVALLLCHQHVPPINSLAMNAFC